MVGIWEQQTGPLITKLRECCRLYTEYQAVYNKTKENSEKRPGCKPFK